MDTKDHRLAGHANRVAKRLRADATRHRPGEAVAPLAALVDRVAVAAGVTPKELRSQVRRQYLTWPRHVAVWVARRNTRHTFGDIAAAVGRADHTTAIHAYRGVCRRISVDDDARADAERIEAAVVRDVGMPSPADGPEPYAVAA